MKEETHYARQLYLFGEGSTKPIKNVKALAKKSGASESTIQNHIQDWRKEAESLAVACKNSPYSLELSPDVLEMHRKEIDFLGKQVKKLHRTLATLQPEASNYHVVLGSYERALTKWEKSSGILAHYNTAEAAMKEKARQHERAKGKANVVQPQLPRKVSTGRFDRG